MSESSAQISRPLQEHIIANKVKHGWNTTDTNVTIYLLGIAEIKGIDLAQAVNDKVTINDHRVYDAQGHKHLE